MNTRSKLLKQKTNNKKKYNYISKLFFRIFLSTIILLGFILIERYSKTDNVIKNKLTTNINFLKIVKNANKIFGNLIDLDNNLLVDNNTFYDEIEYVNDTNVIKNYTFDGCYNFTSGVITKITKENNLYKVTITGIDDFDYVYSNLESIDYSLYSYIEEGAIIGKAKRNNDFYEIKLNVIKDGKYYDYI